MVDHEKSIETALEYETLGNRFNYLMETLLINLYKVFYFLYQAQNQEQRHERLHTKYYTHCIFMVIYTMQLLSLTLPAFQISDSSNFQGFFYGISVFRPDFSAVLFGVGDAFYYLAIILTSVPTLSLIFLYISFLRNKPASPRNYRYLYIYPVKLLKNYIFIPFLFIFMSVYKHSIHPK
jgi:hypothetical protein